MALVLVTGASTGLGLAAATTLASQGHDVVFHARNAERLADASDLDPMCDVVFGDLADVDATGLLAEQVNRLGRLDAVIHNAGVMHGPDVLAVNIIAPYVLTAALLQPRRSIYLSSSMHMSGSTDLDKAGFSGPGTGRQSYEDSKLYLTALALAMAVRRPGAVAHAVDPGWVPTRMGGTGAPDSLAQGHETQEWLSTAPEEEIRPRSGGYWYHRTPREPHRAARDERFQDALLSRLRAATGLDVPS